MPRVKLLLNGAGANNKKVVPLPGTFDELLAKCSQKFSTDDAPFVAAKLFTLDGFEVDEIEVIDNDDTLVVAAADEEFLAVDYLMPSRFPTSSTIPTVASTSSLGSTGAAPVPQPTSTPPPAVVAIASRASSAISPYVMTTPPPPAATPPPPGATPPPVHREASRLHLTVLQAAPLVVQRDEAGGRRMYSMQQLNLPSEREKITDMLREARKTLNISFEIAATDNLRRVVTTGATVLHYSGHGNENFLSFEDGSGASHELTPSLLQSTCGHEDPDGKLRAPDSLRLVFLCACHSQVAAKALEKLGVPHVIAVQSSAQILDAAAVAFTRHLYLALAAGHTVKYAFESGQKAVASMPARLTPQTSGRKEEAKFQLMGAGDPTHGHFALVLGHFSRIFEAI